MKDIFNIKKTPATTEAINKLITKWTNLLLKYETMKVPIQNKTPSNWRVSIPVTVNWKLIHNK